ncbi:hypothetical protein PO909_016240 [Leuciscus waleckii]
MDRKDLANRSGPPKGRHSTLHVGQIRIPQVPDVGRIWAETMLLYLANRSGPPKGRHSTLHVGQIRIPQVPDVGRIWAETMLLCGMASLVVLERHLWLNLTEIKDTDRAVFLDSPVSTTGLFDLAVDGFAERFMVALRRRCATSFPSAPALQDRVVRKQCVSIDSALTSLNVTLLSIRDPGLRYPVKYGWCFPFY